MIPISQAKPKEAWQNKESKSGFNIRNFTC
jgi:hypothetical protein